MTNYHHEHDEDDERRGEAESLGTGDGRREECIFLCADARPLQAGKSTRDSKH